MSRRGVARLTPRRSKYGAVKTEIDGVVFASKAEARRYAELRLLERAGKIWDLELQPRFPLLVPATTGTFKGAIQATAGTWKGQIGEYRGDFAYKDRRGRIVEDVKGYDLPLSRWKRKHVAVQYGIQVEIVRYGRSKLSAPPTRAPRKGTP